MFVDLETMSINLDAIAYIDWKYRSNSIMVALFSTESAPTGDHATGEVLVFENDSVQAQRLKEAFKQVPQFPLLSFKSITAQNSPIAG